MISLGARARFWRILHNVTVPVEGTIVGRTREQNPRYDLRAGPGETYTNIPEEQLEAIDA